MTPTGSSYGRPVAEHHGLYPTVSPWARVQAAKARFYASRLSPQLTAPSVSAPPMPPAAAPPSATSEPRMSAFSLPPGLIPDRQRPDRFSGIYDSHHSRDIRGIRGIYDVHHSQGIRHDVHICTGSNNPSATGSRRPTRALIRVSTSFVPHFAFLRAQRRAKGIETRRMIP